MLISYWVLSSISTNPVRCQGLRKQRFKEGILFQSLRLYNLHCANKYHIMGHIQNTQFSLRHFSSAPAASTFRILMSTLPRDSFFKSSAAISLFYGWEGGNYNFFSEANEWSPQMVLFLNLLLLTNRSFTQPLFIPYKLVWYFILFFSCSEGCGRLIVRCRGIRDTGCIPYNIVIFSC